MTMMSTGMARRRGRDSEDDVDTGVFNRRASFDLDSAMILQIMRELQPRMEPHLGARPLSSCALPAIPVVPNVFLTPSPTDPPPPWARPIDPPSPWARPLDPPPPRARPLEETSRDRDVVVRRSKLPWFGFAVSFAIAFGVVHDPVLRRQTVASIQGAALHAYQSSHGAISRVISR